MYVIDIYWDDLIKEKQDEILEVIGDNGNYDIVPIATICSSEEDNSEDEYH